MRTETALFLNHRAGTYSVSLFAGVLLGCLLCAHLVACKSGSGKGGASPDGGSGGLAGCSTNVGNAPATATTLLSGQAVQNTICYQGISDWYQITVPPGNDLVDIAAGYPAGIVTPVDLDVKIFVASDDASGTLVQDLTAPAGSDAGPSAIGTTVRVPGAGDYYIQVTDSHGASFDSDNAYTVQVTSAADPDTHEPNDSPALANP
ncbi:MAG: hypothetical protein ABTD50_22630, partial [Polyangiaceae bacterium]